MKLLVVNSLVDDLKNVKDTEICEEKSELLARLKEFLKEYKMVVIDTELRNEFRLVYIETENAVKYKIKDFRVLDEIIKNYFLGVVPIFSFESLNGMQRKCFIEENISFCIKGKEIYICARYV